MKNSLKTQKTGKNIVTAFFVVLSLVYVFPVFMVLLNS